MFKNKNLTFDCDSKQLCLEQTVCHIITTVDHDIQAVLSFKIQTM